MGQMRNFVQLIGALGKDPEVRSMQAGGEVVTLSLATNERWKDPKTGEAKSLTEWHKVVIFNESIGRTAKTYLRKGSTCLITGKLQTRKWSKDGVDRYSTEIVLQKYQGSLELLDGRQSDAAERGGGAERSAGADSGYTGGAADLDDDVPF